MPVPFVPFLLPLSILILNELGDLIPLHAVLLASPIAYRIFGAHYIEILSSNLSDYPAHLQYLLRIVLVISSHHSRHITSSVLRNLTSITGFPCNDHPSGMNMVVHHSPSSVPQPVSRQVLF